LSWHAYVLRPRKYPTHESRYSPRERAGDGGTVEREGLSKADKRGIRMMRQPEIKKHIAIVPVIFALSSCGGASGPGFNPPPPPPPDLGTAQGLWHGMTGDNRTFSGLVLDDGTYWFLYTAVGNSAVLAGAIQGSGTFSNGQFASSNGLDFHIEGANILNFSMAGAYTEKSELDGTLTYTTGSTNTFTSTYDTDYDLTPSLSMISGNYSGQALTVNSGVEAATVMIGSGGAITGTSAGGFSFTGTVTTRAKGNAYNISVTFDGGVCDNGADTVTGVGYYIAAQNELVSIALNSGRTNGFIFSGTKP
jgi:hypothetical protein